MHLVFDFILEKSQGKFDFLLRWKVGNDRGPEKALSRIWKVFWWLKKATAYFLISTTSLYSSRTYKKFNESFL